MSGSAKTSGNSENPCPQDCDCLTCEGTLQLDVVGVGCSGTGTGLGAGLDCPCLYTGSILMANCNEEFLSVEFNCETGDITISGTGCGTSGTLTKLASDPVVWSGELDFNSCCPGCGMADVVIACV